MPKIKNNIIEITGTGNVIDSKVRIISIQAIASADTSEAIITDDDGMEIAHFKSAETNLRTYVPIYLDRMEINGINCDVFTNMTKVIIHLG
jgi:hypothetical protein